MVESFSPTVLMQGKDYQQKGYVLSIRLSEGLLKARVKGKSSQIFDVYIDLKTWPDKPAHCTCQHFNNCEHAAASLFALQSKENMSVPASNHQLAEPSLESWLQTWRTKQDTKSENTHSVIYYIEPQFNAYEHRVIIRLALAKKLKNGRLGKKIIFNSLSQSREQYFSPVDKEIIKALMLKCGVKGWFDRLIIRNSEIIEQILQTNRTYLYQPDEPPLKLESDKPVQLYWRLASDGRQSLVIEVDGQLVQPLLLDKILYYDDKHHTVGLLNQRYSLNEIKPLFELAAITLEQAVEVKKSIINPDLPQPTLYVNQQIKKVLPLKIISFDAVKMLPSKTAVALNSLETQWLFIIEFLFEYEGIRVSANETSSYVVYQQEDTLIKIERDFNFERQAQEQCKLLIPFRTASLEDKLATGQDLRKVNILLSYQREQDLASLHNQIIPQLKKQGWQVIFNAEAYEEIVTAEQVEWFSELKDKGHDFFAYQLGILIDGKSIDIVPLVANLITKLQGNEVDEIDDEMLVNLPLPDGKRLQLKMERLKPLIRFLLQYGNNLTNNTANITINRYQLILLQETEQAIAASAVRWQGVNELRHKFHQLANQNWQQEIAVPKGLATVLRDYQQEGLSWLQFLRQTGFGGILADDMGLGKTIQTLAHLQVEKEADRLKQASLIIAPTSLVVNWFEEAKRFTPDLKILVFHGSERHDIQFHDYEIIISTYGLIQRDKKRFVEYDFYYLILDEAQSIKNARAKTTQIIQQIKAQHRLCLSGTPLENHLGELWSLFNFLMPGLLGDHKQFRKFFRTPIEKNSDLSRGELLANRVKPFMLRRTKNQVANELPLKTEVTRFITLTGSQRDLYEAIRMSMEKKVRDAIAKQGIGKSHIVVLDALLKLRQVCCHPQLLSLPEAQMAYNTSAKLAELMELLDSLMEEKRYVLIFSQFTSMLKIIEEQLLKRNFAYLKLTGQSQNRQQLVNAFQQGNAPIFLISLKAGGTGLNLTRADTVIHYDPWWNPAVEDQATDRSHRIGQVNPVFVYKLITSGTVEEVILSMQQKKRQLFEGILAENAGSIAALTSQDIENLFLPLEAIEET